MPRLWGTCLGEDERMLRLQGEREHAQVLGGACGGGGFGLRRRQVRSLRFRRLTALISSLRMPRPCSDFPQRLRGSGGGGAANEMLVVMLLAAATLRLCPLARAQPLCRIHTVRTGKMFHVGQPTQGVHLYFSSATARLIKHPCKKNIALYLGKQLFLTRNNFESSLLPFSIPTSMQVGIPEVTSAHFASSVLLLVVNRKVYIYDYEADSWNASIGIKHPVSHISGDNCCYSEHPFCLDISNSVFAYLLGDLTSQTNIYFSNTQGYRFQKYAHERQAELVGTLGGIFYFHSLSQIGLLLIDQGKAKFGYSDHPLNHSLGLPFDYNGTLDILLTPGQKGILIFWYENSLLVSRNAGQLVDPVPVREGHHILYSSISEANVTIHSVAANENELAVLTRENNLYYGSLGILSSFLIKFADQNIWSQEAVLMFTDLGILEILTPLPDSFFPAFDFQKCPVNIQAILMDPQLQVDFCKVCDRNCLTLCSRHYFFKTDKSRSWAFVDGNT